MLQESFWKIFEDTGSVDSYIFYREMAERNNAEEQKEIVQAEATASQNAG